MGVVCQQCLEKLYGYLIAVFCKDSCGKNDYFGWIINDNCTILKYFLKMSMKIVVYPHNS